MQYISGLVDWYGYCFLVYYSTTILAQNLKVMRRTDIVQHQEYRENELARFFLHHCGGDKENASAAHRTVRMEKQRPESKMYVCVASCRGIVYKLIEHLFVCSCPLAP